MGVKKIGSIIGHGHNKISKLLVEAGVHIPRNKKVRPTFDEVFNLFNSGIGVAGIGKRFGFAAATIEKILAANGVKKRNRSEQQKARMDSYSIQKIKSLTKNANLAAKGRKVSFEEKAKAAKTCEKTGYRNISKYEDFIKNHLEERGISFTPQKAIGKYNCDFAIGSIAVEVFGGKWHWYGQHLARTDERFKYIMNAGFDIFVIAVNESHPLTIASIENLISYIEHRAANPSPIREYRVVWSAGKFITAGSINDENISIKPPFTNARNIANGRYESIPR
jgi:very-short-patch-repair endonuclease